MDKIKIEDSRFLIKYGFIILHFPPHVKGQHLVLNLSNNTIYIPLEEVIHLLHK